MPDSNEKKPSDSGLRKAQPVSVPKADGSDSQTPSVPPANKGGTVFGKVRDAAAAVVSTAGGALSNGFRSLKNSGFGFKTAAASVSSGVGSMADFLHVPKKGMAAVLIALLLGGGITGGIMISNYTAQQLLLRQEDYYDECSDLLADAGGLSLPAMPSGQISAEMEEVAKKIWALGKKIGLTDEQCAGMLGNAQQESGLDPTALEGYFGEPFMYGSKKASLVGQIPLMSSAEMNTYTTQSLGQAGNSGYKYDGVNYCCGLGIIQYTGPSASALITYAKSHGGNWYDLDQQLSFMLTNPSFKDRMEKFKGDSKNANSVADATASFLGYVTSGSGHARYDEGSYSTRVSYANDWYARFSAQSYSITNEFSDFADDIISLSGTVAGAATGLHVSSLQAECGSVSGSPDNSSMAAAAVAYAWETKEMGFGNDGTALYRAVHDAMFPGDDRYQSCDRGVASAVVWSGADDNFPWQSTAEQDRYLSTHSGPGSSLWEFVGLYDTLYMDESNFLPGDIIITTSARRGTTHGHVIMYVGNELIQAKYPGASGVFVSASFGKRSPGCGDALSYYDGDGYHVYRYVGDYSGVKKNLYAGSASGTSG